MLIYFGNNQADLCRQVKETLHYGNKRCKIEKIVKNKLTPDNMITFNKPVYFFGDAYKNDDSIDAIQW